MKILYLGSFKERFNRQISYIAKDSHNRALNFRDGVKAEIETLKTNPYRCRKSIYFNDESIRDLIFKGYTITYRIKPNLIEVFGFKKYQEGVED